MRVGAERVSARLDAFLDYFIPMEIRVRPDAHRRARMFMLSHVFGPFLGNVIPVYLYFVLGMEADYRLWIFAISITAFWVYGPLLKWTRAYDVLAFISVENLLFCILWACYAYGGVYSPFLPWVLITPTLAFLYFPSKGRVRDGLLLLITLNVGLFAGLVLSGYPFPETDLEQFQVIGIISTISASIYVTMMSLYFARVLKEQQQFEREVGDLLATAENLRSLTAAAQQASLAKANFVASTSHELRTPLNAVIGYSQLLLDDAIDEGDDEIVQDLENIKGAGTHLLRLVNDILDYSKIDAGKMDVYPSRDDVRERVGEIARLVAADLAERGYTLDCRLPENGLLMEVDWTALSKGLSHILLGAPSAPEGGSLTLEVKPGGGDTVEFRICDPRGAADGRPVETLFDIFHDDRDASPTKYGGAGIGLALGQKFLSLIDAEIRTSHGTAGERIFAISIPLEARVAEPEATAA
jgi:signal transduction histidine kinase